DFVSRLISLANIMKKTFYVVVPYDPVSVQHLNVLDRLFKKGQVFDHIKISDEDFKSHTDTLKERGNVIAGGLGSMGLHCFQLSSEDLIELFYQIYNPDIASKERIKDATLLAAPIVVAKDEITTVNKEAAALEANQMIDNASIVEEQRKQQSQQRQQEAQKTGERAIRQQPVATATPAPVAQPQTPVPQLVSQSPQVQQPPSQINDKIQMANGK
ncbi:MAG TPA: hypothetical protein PK263_05310, partial [bacterium]|nr:hypothetical protein [bacterium]